MNANKIGMVKASLRYLDPAWIPNADLGQGVFNGLVSGMMAFGGYRFKDALDKLAEISKDMDDFHVDIDRIPVWWRADFARAFDI